MRMVCRLLQVTDFKDGGGHFVAILQSEVDYQNARRWHETKSPQLQSVQALFPPQMVCWFKLVSYECNSQEAELAHD